MLEQGIQHGASTLVLLGQFVGLPNLSGNLPLSDDKAIETGGHSQQMADRGAMAVLVQVGPHISCRHSVHFSQELGNPVDVRDQGRGRPGQVQLNTIARAQDDGLAAVTSIQFVQRPCQLCLVERQPFAERNRSVAEAATDSQEVHG
jgi:hypothetical protein